ncbi:DNA alkylation repair protein [Alistipes sp.]|uniref:DNA alkylation repair protein n=1 Tax=Alistipes sp. TaxID=1872444 RepID=UPI0025C61C33|nr:DNA alkylation repair protein [Alistipes sp.]
MIEEILTPFVAERFIHEEKYRQGHIRIIRPLPGVEVLGLHIPEMKALAKRLVGEGRGAATIELLSSHKEAIRIHEEKMIWGLIINRLPLSLDERLEHFRAFVPQIDNWAVCDTFCSDAQWLRRARADVREQTWRFLEPYFCSHSEFEVRFALVFSLAHFLDEAHIDRIFHFVERLHYEKIVSAYGDMHPYYVQMAVAWLMATALCKMPEKTRRFANSGKCPPPIIRLYIRKAKESFRTKNMSPL